MREGIVTLVTVGLSLLLVVLGLVVVWKMITNKIDLKYLIAEEDGSASLSRFQFLVFTFVVAFGYFLLVVKSGSAHSLPAVGDGVWQLLGISGGSYVLSKGIQKYSGVEQEKSGLPPAVTPPADGGANG